MLIIVIAVSAAIVIYSVTLIVFGRPSKDRVKARIKRLSEKTDLGQVHDTVLKEKKIARKNEKKSRLISQRFQDNLAMSGLQLTAREFMLLWCGLTFIPAVLGSLFGMKALAIIGLSIVGFAIPPFLMNQAKTKRQLLFNKQLGESLTIMSNCMRSGYSFQQAMNSIAKEMQPPISLEFGRVVREINYGSSMETSLNNMVARNDNKDLALLVAAVNISTQVGANLSDILNIIAETVSDRIRLREDVRVASSQGRMSGLIIGLLPIVVIIFLMIVNPTYFTGFAENTIGKVLLGISAFMEIIGFLVINKIVDIKY